MLRTIITTIRAIRQQRRAQAMIDNWMRVEADVFVREVEQWHSAGHPRGVPPVVVEAVDGGLS